MCTSTTLDNVIIDLLKLILVLWQSRKYFDRFGLLHFSCVDS